MAFVVEDGTGLVNSNSYVAVQEYRDYYADRGIDKSSETDAQIEGYLVRSTEFVDLTYKFLEDTLTTTQALEFPRLIDEVDTELPSRVVYATIIMGNHLATTVDPYDDPIKNIKSKKEKVGPIETDISYVTGGNAKPSNPAVNYPSVTAYLKPYLDTTGLSYNQLRAISG